MMYVTLEHPFGVSEKGARLNNEDAIYPPAALADPEQRLFMVCDGVGGAEKGEVASALACDSFQSFFSTLQEDDPSEDFIKKAVRYTESRFDEYASLHPEAKGMATTMAMVYFGRSGVTVAHIGDSRVYHIRDGEILFQTEDHSLVNSWVKLGMISPEEAVAHPKRNVITRAIQGIGDATDPEVVLLHEVTPGDLLFICTDGVNESVRDEQLTSVFLREASVERMKRALDDYCNAHSRDNYSFYLLPIKSVQKG